MESLALNVNDGAHFLHSPVVESHSAQFFGHAWHVSPLTKFEGVLHSTHFFAPNKLPGLHFVQD